MTVPASYRGFPRTVGIIGVGQIGHPVVRALARGQVEDWKLGPVLARQTRTIEGVDVLDEPDDFFGHDLDLVIEAAGPGALAVHGRSALAAADVWSVSGTAMADPTLRTDLARVGAQHGHRLRLVPGGSPGWMA